MPLQLRDFAKKLTPKGWAMIGGSIAAGLVFLVLLMNFASQPSYSTLLTGLDPAQTGKITSALDAKGIGYQLQNGGTALAVNSSQTSQARIALAGSGLLSSQQPGFSLLNSQPLGQSSFQQQITYERALEGQLDQTIEQIQGIDSAQVNLVLPNPQDQLFADNSQTASASVLLSGANSQDPGTVKGIASLVASSVPGLQSDKVTITDSSGQLVWPTSDSTSGGSGSLLAKQSAETRYDAMMAAQANAMLTQILGPGKAQVQINADLNANQATSDSLVYAKKGVPLQSQTQTETLTGGGAGAGGVAGSASNIAAYAAGGGGGNSNYRNTTSNITYGVDKTVTHATIAPGAVNRQTVAVLVDKSVPKSELPAIQAAVANTVGLNAKRGDTISFGQLAFTKQPTAATPTSPTAMIGYAKYAVIGLGALLFLFFTTRMLRRRESEEFVGQPTWLRELATPRPLAALERGEHLHQQPTRALGLRPTANPTKRAVEQLVEQNPDRVAAQVRAWMAED